MELRERKILVTGGAGFIGTHLCRALRRAGARVTVLDNLLPQVHGERPEIPEGVEFVFGDVCDAAVVAKVVGRAEALVHLAAETGVGQSMEEIARYVRVNSLGTAVVLEACAKRAKPLSTVVLASSRAVYGEGSGECANCGEVKPDPRSPESLRAGQWEPTCPRCGEKIEVLAQRETQAPRPTSVYGGTKLEQEHLFASFAASTGTPAVALRFQNVYGPGQSLRNPYTGILAIFSNLLREGHGIPLYEDGQMRRDFVYVEDVVDAIETALRQAAQTGTKALRIYNVGLGTPATVAATAELLRKAWNAEKPSRITGQFRVGDIRHAWADCQLARKELGWQAKVSLAEGLRMLKNWVEKQTAESAVR
jgi:dTDP-L-rhamnose 4-epimerase